MGPLGKQIKEALRLIEEVEGRAGESRYEDGWVKLMTLCDTWSAETDEIDASELVVLQEALAHWPDQSKELSEHLLYTLIPGSVLGDLLFGLGTHLHLPFWGSGGASWIFANSHSLEGIKIIDTHHEHASPKYRAIFTTKYPKSTLHTLKFTDAPSKALWKKIVEGPLCEQLTTLHVNARQLTGAKGQLAPLIEALPSFEHLQHLHLGYFKFNPALIESISRCTSLRSFSIEHCSCPQELVDALLSALPSQLEGFSILGSMDELFVGLLQCDSFHVLKELRFSRSGDYKCQTSAAFPIEALCTSSLLPGLTTLNLSGSPFNKDIVKVLAESPGLADLKVLDLSNGALGDEGFQAIFASPFLVKLQKLKLNDSEITTKALRTLAKNATSHPLESLEELYLHNNKGITKSAGKVLASWEGLSRLRYLGCRDCKLYNPAPDDLRRSANLVEDLFIDL